MNYTPQSRVLPRLAGVGALSIAVLLTLPQAAALADTSAATARSALVTTSAGVDVTSGQTSASNDGSAGRDDEGADAAVSVLGSQDLLSAGLLTQKASAAKDGTSAACAGLVGSGGSVSIGSDGTCTVSAGAAEGAVLRLSSTVSLKADAIISSCTASSSGTATAQTQLINASLYTTTGVTTTRTALPGSPVSGADVSVAGLASIKLNTQDVPSGTGSIRATALTVKLAASTAAVTLGTVTCGPNALVLPTSALPVKGLPLFGGLLLVLGALVWWRRGRPVPSRLRVAGARS